MAWRYCENCNWGQDKITLQEVMEKVRWHNPIVCHNCGYERSDYGEKLKDEIIFEHIEEINERLEKLERMRLPD